MPLASMKTLLADALANGYAVSYCESWNLESLQSVLEAASELGSPVIAGFSGRFLLDHGRTRPENLKYYAGMAKAIEDSPVPVAFLLNESDSFSQICEAMDLGFNAVMIENEGLSLPEYRDLVCRVVNLAVRRNVSVEAQLGHLPMAGDPAPGEVTEAASAKAFVAETGVDALAVSVGNIHLLTRGRAPLHLDVLDAIHAVVDIPLVLHGGTGFPREYASAAIKLGVAKFNFGTVLKQAFLAGMNERLGAYAEPMNPHPFLGMGGPQDVMIAGREAMSVQVKEILMRFGSAGRAQQPGPVSQTLKIGATHDYAGSL
jgi:fructose-bisphosphate aldolase class II